MIGLLIIGEKNTPEVEDNKQTETELRLTVDEQEEIVYGEIERQVEAAVAFGAAAVCLPAYGSEFYKLTESERLEVVRSAVSASGGRIPWAGPQTKKRTSELDRWTRAAIP